METTTKAYWQAVDDVTDMIVAQATAPNAQQVRYWEQRIIHRLAEVRDVAISVREDAAEAAEKLI